MRLPDQIVKSLGPIFSGENLVTHALQSNAANRLAKTEIRIVGRARFDLPIGAGNLKRLPYNVRSFWLSVGRWTLSVGRF